MLEGEIIENSLSIAFRYGLTLYDSVYIALAETEDVELYTADQKVIAKVPSDNIRHIREYPGNQEKMFIHEAISHDELDIEHRTSRRESQLRPTLIHLTSLKSRRPSFLTTLRTLRELAASRK